MNVPEARTRPAAFEAVKIYTPSLELSERRAARTGAASKTDEKDNSPSAP